METELLNERDVQFQLYEVLETSALSERARFNEHNVETFNAAISTARQIAEDKFANHNAKLDCNEPRFDGEKVSILPEVKEAFDALAEAGFLAGRDDYERGGMQLPEVIMAACMGYFTSANASSAAYPFLTIAAANLIKTYASDRLKDDFLSPMLAGQFTGTMAMTEPHAGSSLADITTQAKASDTAGQYLIKGNKMFISGGDHEMADNIIHLVLAKIEGAPSGVKGISLFLVPKYRLDEDAKPADRNDVALTGLIHKLGYRGTTSTMLSFGDNNECLGYLIGEEHQGLRYMFQMMNEARLGVSMGAAMIGYRGYLSSLSYAKERLQGRLASQKADDKPVEIIQHADVRRMLLEQKAYVEGAMSLCLFGYALLDDVHTHPDADERQKAELLLDLLTPVIKSWSSEVGVKANDLAIQVLGGAGYTREFSVEQYWRDNRLNPIHEGTNGIQALDLLGRKLWQRNSKGLQILVSKVSSDLSQANESSKKLQAWAQAIEEHLSLVHRVTMQLGADLQKGSPDLSLSNASTYLSMFARVVVSWLWLRQALAAEKGIAETEPENHEELSFYRGKLQAAQYYIKWQLPLAKHEADLLLGRDDTSCEMQPNWF